MAAHFEAFLLGLADWGPDERPVRKNKDLPRLLRAMAAGTDAQESRHDIIFTAAADEIERLWKIEDSSTVR